MALNGQLNDFNLAEILQLIATQQKSGFLVLEGHREMVFVFDKGVLISTCDRRSMGPDPLEIYLQDYGFFSDSQWAHISYIRQNTSLDLAEILVSEELVLEPALDAILQNVAREMTHRGMKMRRGRYHFTATKDTPPGVRKRIAMDVQGLLMEAARRVDEESELQRFLPNQVMTFVQGSVPPPPDSLTPVGKRIIKLALGNRPLGKIIRLARCDSFTTRELLKTFVEEGWLEGVLPEVEHNEDSDKSVGRARHRKRSGLRHPVISALTVLVVLGFGAFRWTPLLLGELALIGLAEPVVTAGGDVDDVPVSWLEKSQLSCRHLRLRQIKAEIGEAARQYHTEHGVYPAALTGLVEDGMLALKTWQTVERLGWQYARGDAGQAYRLEL